MRNKLSKIRILRVRHSVQNRLLEREELKLLKMKDDYKKSLKIITKKP